MLHSIQNAATFQDAWERLVRTSMMRLIGPLFGDYADGEARSFVMNEGFHATYEWHDPEALAACFGRKSKKRVDQITAILDTLKALGLID